MAALLLLSLIMAGSALKADLMPGLDPGLVPHFERQALPLAIAALAAAIIALARRAKWPSGRQLWRHVLIGLGLFSVPGMLLFYAGSWVPGLVRTALFTLVPIFAVVFEPYIGSSGSSPEVQQRGALVAALIAVAGALLVFPVAIPATVEAGEAFIALALAAACIAAANCLGVAVAARPGRDAFAVLIAVAAASAAIADGFASALLEQTVWRWDTLQTELLWSIAVEVPAILLLFWLMPRISATQMSTRYLLAPVLAILIGATVLQSLQQLRLRTWLGLFLMAAGSAWLLFAPSDETSEDGLPLKLER